MIYLETNIAYRKQMFLSATTVESLGTVSILVGINAASVQLFQVVSRGTASFYTCSWQS